MNVRSLHKIKNYQNLKKKIRKIKVFNGTQNLCTKLQNRK